VPPGTYLVILQEQNENEEYPIL